MVQLSDLPAVDTVTLVITTEWLRKSLLNISGNVCLLFIPLKRAGVSKIGYYSIKNNDKINFRKNIIVILGP